MTSTKADPGPFDAFDKARPDEPIFVLLGRDPSAPATVTEWCRLRRNRALKEFDHSSDALAAELRQCAEAEAIALGMGDYRAGLEAVAEGERGGVGNYSGLTGESIEVRDHRLAAAEAVAHLREAAFHFSEGRERLIALGLLAGMGPFTPRSTKATLNDINELADEVSPKRPGVQPDLPIEAAA